jgi:hypothetical protein
MKESLVDLTMVFVGVALIAILIVLGVPWLQTITAAAGGLFFLFVIY